jgi:hypothetical protein
MKKPIKLRPIRLVRVKDGDIVLLKVKEHITMQQTINVRDNLKLYFPKNVVIVLDASADVSVVREGTYGNRRL